MSYVHEQLNVETKEMEYIVVDSNGIKAPPPYGGPFSSKETAIANCALMKKHSIEDWIAAHTESKRVNQIEGHGKVLHIAADGRWIQNRGRSTFAVHPPTVFELEIGELVSVDKFGEIELPDRDHGHCIDRP